MKHIVLLFDGTWNSAATGHYDDITNIFRLNLAVSRDDNLGNPQVVFYMPGPGTRGLVDEKLGGAFGQGIDEIIREAYVNLASNYNEGDIIYLFGFSRGAIVSRALSCLIAESGLLRPQRLYLLPIAWKRFVNINQGKELHPGLIDLKEHVHPGVRIKFIGLFDSVLGRDATHPTIFSELVFSNNKLSQIIDIAIHILSVDDNRKIFFPLLWDELDPNIQEMEQIWLPGVHGDIGGIGARNFLGIISLLTMIARIKKYTNIKINEEFLSELIARFNSIEDIHISDERTGRLSILLDRSDRLPHKEFKNMMIHAIAGTLHMRKFDIRDSLDIYCAEHLNAFLLLPTARDCYSPLQIAAAADALSKVT